MPQLRFPLSSCRIPTALTAMAVIACGVLTTSASAQTLFTDGFESDGPGGLTITSLTNWIVSRGSVDVIGPGTGFDFYPGNGLYLDLDGTSGGGISGAGLITTKQLFNLTPGDYALSFSLGKNGSNAESMQVSVGSAFSTSVSGSGGIAALTPLTYNFTVTTGTSGNISFDHAGGDDAGYIIDNVSLVRVSSTAPEPGTLSLLAVVPAALGIIRFRRRK
jgi:hypothetical protein